MRKGKYNNRQVKEDGYVFASQMEHRRYCELKLLIRSGKIEGLIVHPKFQAIVNGVRVCNIILDFQYYEISSRGIVYEDTKGYFPPISRLKFKLLRALYPDVDVRLLTAR